jgi:Ca2+-binding RTX toxin-like protein
VLQGSADLQGYGNYQVNTIYGNAGNNLINGAGGADTMLGGAGNDTYFVDNAGDVVSENPNEGTDAVFSEVAFTLSVNLETLVLQGVGDVSGTGNALANSIFGNSGNNTLDGLGGADILTGNAATTSSCFISGRPTATPSSISPATARRRETRCGSPAMAQARPSPTSMPRTGGSTLRACRRSSRSATAPQSIQATSRSCNDEGRAITFSPIVWNQLLCLRILERAKGTEPEALNRRARARISGPKRTAHFGGRRSHHTARTAPLRPHPT